MPQAVADEQGQVWAEWWSGAVHETTNPVREVPSWKQTILEANIPQATKATVALIRRASNKFAKQTVDGIHPRQIRHLSEGLLEALAEMAQVWNTALAWPGSEAEVTTALLGKPDGGLRPIALF